MLTTSLYMNTVHDLPSSARLIAGVRAEIEREFATLHRSQPHLLYLALKEAEAIAWQTDYPELVFPVLAWEKARQIAAWHERQSRLHSIEPQLAFAA